MIQKYLSDDARAFPEPSSVNRADEDDARYKDALDQRIERLLTDFDKRGYDSELMEHIMEYSPREACAFLVKLGRNTNRSIDLDEIETAWHKFLRAEARRMAVGQLEAEG